MIVSLCAIMNRWHSINKTRTANLRNLGSKSGKTYDPTHRTPKVAMVNSSLCAINDCLIRI